MLANAHFQFLLEGGCLSLDYDSLVALHPQLADGFKESYESANRPY